MSQMDEYWDSQYDENLPLGWVTEEDDRAMWEEHLQDSQARAERILSTPNYERLRADIDALQDLWVDRAAAYDDLINNRGDDRAFAAASAAYDVAATDFAADYADLCELTYRSGVVDRVEASTIRAELADGLPDAARDQYQEDIRAAILGGMPFKDRMNFVERDMARGAEPRPKEAQDWMDKETISQFKSRDLDVEWAHGQFERTARLIKERMMCGYRGDEPDCSAEDRKRLMYGKLPSELEHEAQMVAKSAEERLADFVDYAEALMDRQPVLYDDNYRDVFERYVDSQYPVVGREKKKSPHDLSNVDYSRRMYEEEPEVAQPIQARENTVGAMIDKSKLSVEDAARTSSRTYGDND